MGTIIMEDQTLQTQADIETLYGPWTKDGRSYEEPRLEKKSGGVYRFHGSFQAFQAVVDAVEHPAEPEPPTSEESLARIADTLTRATMALEELNQVLKGRGDGD